ncbi:MAG: (2Fe-2S)-binding protein [Firmicutes bacterium]|nr:(2Fe-2S)-binding protein [Bacillota bacterium]
MRINKHPILSFKRGKEITFTYNGKKLIGYEGETILASLHANEVKVISHSIDKSRPRGLFCAIGNCSSCFMEVNGEPNVKTCIEPLKEGMVIKNQKGKGNIL